MSHNLAEQITERIEQITGLYHRMVLVVGPAGAGKTAALRELAKAKSYPLINVNLDLSQRLLELTEKQRSLRCGQIVKEIVDQAGGPVVLLDNLEIVFDPALRQDPLRLLQGISRNRTIVATWNGLIAEGNLIYSEAGHPEYRQYSASDLLTVLASPAE
ncbi:MAG: BREX-3 system P-loop-containing protein BrxF [Chloroflexota bacterium]